MNSVVKFTGTHLAMSATIFIAASAFTPPAHAVEGDYHRFQVCQQLKSSGSVRWHGIASGTIDDAHAVFEHSRSFHTRACFSNKRACQTWVKRIWWEIPTMDELRTAYCKRI